MRPSIPFLLLLSLCAVAPACINLSTTDSSGAGGFGGEGGSSNISSGSGSGSGSTSMSSSGAGGGGGATLPGWTFRRPVIIGAQQQDITDFVLLVATVTDGLFGPNVQPDGDDLVFTDSDGTTILPHELEFFSMDSGATTFRAWVRVPLIPTAGKTIYLYYGNSLIGPQQNPAATWQKYKAVYHLEGNFDDASSNGHNGTVKTVPGAEPTMAQGQIGAGLDFPGGSYGEVPDSPDFNCITSECTVSMWINSSGQSSHVIDHYSGNGSGAGWNIGTENGQLTYEHGGSSPILLGVTFPNNEWHHVAVVKDLSLAVMYVDGAQVQAKFFGAGLINAVAPLYIGTGNPDANFFVGQLDEVRIASTVRDVAWFQTEIRNVLLGNDFLYLGPPEQL